MLQPILIAAFGGVAAYFIWMTVSRFMAETDGTVWERLLAAGSDSATKLWARFMVIVGAGLGLLTTAADYLGDPGLSAAIQQYLDPRYVGAAMILISLVTIWARRRTLKS